MRDFSDHQIAYDNQREYHASNMPEPNDNDALEDKMCAVMDSNDFPTEAECRAVGLTHSKFVELVQIVAQRQIDRDTYSFT